MTWRLSAVVAHEEFARPKAVFEAIVTDRLRESAASCFFTPDIEGACKLGLSAAIGLLVAQALEHQRYRAREFPYADVCMWGDLQLIAQGVGNHVQSFSAMLLRGGCATCSDAGDGTCTTDHQQSETLCTLKAVPDESEAK